MEIPNHKHDLGIQVIDRDHREISELLVEINFNAARDGDAARRIHSLRELARATRSHFLLEEGLMDASKFPAWPCTGCGTNGCWDRYGNWPTIGACRRMR